MIQAREGDKVMLGGEEWTVVSVYTRAQAIADGELVDVSAKAGLAGIRLPVAVTRRVWAECAGAVPEQTAGRLSAVVWALREAIRRVSGVEEDRVWFKVPLCDRVLDLWALCGPGDDLKPVLTVMFADED